MRNFLDAEPAGGPQAPREPVDMLASVLSEFARTLLTDFSIQEILDHLVLRIVDALPVTAAGVSLIAPGSAPRYVAASNEAALDYERLQTSLGHGPCMEAFETGTLVVAPDLREETRFPEFTKAALDLGLGAVFSAPLRHSSGRLGALDLYREDPGPLSERDLVSAQTLADVATAYVLNAEAREEARTSAELFRENSLHDPLTGLPNRMLMIQRMQHAGQRARRTHTVAAVLFADLDSFKQVNDTHGHEVGDLLLIRPRSRSSRSAHETPGTGGPAGRLARRHRRPACSRARHPGRGGERRRRGAPVVHGLRRRRRRARDRPPDRLL